MRRKRAFGKINGNITDSVREFGKNPIAVPYPVKLNPVLYLSRTNGGFDKSTNGDTYVNEWIDPYSGLKATQSTGGYRPTLESDGVKFDGTDDYLDAGNISDINNAKALTISFYFKNLSISKNQWFFVKKDNNDNLIQAFIYSDSFFIRTRFDIDGIKEIYDFSYNDVDNWHHYVVVFESGNLKVYLDNNKKIDKVVGNQLDVSGLSYFIFSRRIDEYTVNGYCDEHVIYPYALTETQITNLYNYTKNLKGI